MKIFIFIFILLVICFLASIYLIRKANKDNTSSMELQPIIVLRELMTIMKIKWKELRFLVLLAMIRMLFLR